MTHDENDAQFLVQAINLAEENSARAAGGPFGAVVVRKGKVISEAGNRVTALNDPTAHAEIGAIREACRLLQTFQLDDCTIYCSCEPCPMCFGAIYWARLSRVVYAADADMAAAHGFDDSLIYREITLAPAKRVRTFHRLEHPKMESPFHAWDANQGKTRY